MGYFYGIELVKDRDTRESFSEEEGELLLRGLLSPRIFELGLICRGRRPGRPGHPALAAVGGGTRGVRTIAVDPPHGLDRVDGGAGPMKGHEQ